MPEELPQSVDSAAAKAKETKAYYLNKAKEVLSETRNKIEALVNEVGQSEYADNPNPDDTTGGPTELQLTGLREEIDVLLEGIEKDLKDSD